MEGRGGGVERRFSVAKKATNTEKIEVPEKNKRKKQKLCECKRLATTHLFPLRVKPEARSIYLTIVQQCCSGVILTSYSRSSITNKQIPG